MLALADPIRMSRAVVGRPVRRLLEKLFGFVRLAEERVLFGPVVLREEAGHVCMQIIIAVAGAPEPVLAFGRRHTHGGIE